MINQTPLVHDVLSIHSKFDVVGIFPDAVLSHSWWAVAPVVAEEALECVSAHGGSAGVRLAVATLDGNAWLGIAA
ncbi:MULTISPECIES: hypothetical protein [unclassified Marinobacter]|jgi:hypothetical protein|uniref:hypothetical protein n=1 Tax=unclassified Marinobacter TaxID=83889 RepID=UPI002010ADB3|nr:MULTISPECIES: hypothetical protein [unclassified Marinobacter]UQG57891.1 hypothetical protein MIH16_09765 [Marinobacter sp. M4C]UQG66696.1 hypothetical protein MIH17_09770 [Marinobacter sp. M2C]UQG70976.1 hypothetical protein MIH19_09765 [Marinobacter sp. M1C]